MKWYVNPKCTHAFILHMFPIIKCLPKVLILHPLGLLMNFQINIWNSLYFKPISNLTMVCYHQNLIRRTLGLTQSKQKHQIIEPSKQLQNKHLQICLWNLKKKKKYHFKVDENPFQNKFKLIEALCKKTPFFLIKVGSAKNMDGMHSSSMKSSIKGPILIIVLIPCEICKNKEKKRKKKLRFH